MLRLVELPRSSSDGGTLITLPKNHAFRLPRALPVPRASSAPKTRWEKFAQEKGIVKRKRSRKVWDETIQDWAPRYGAYSIKKNQEKAQAIVEMKPGDDPEEDPFEKISREKAMSKAKQKYREMRNQMEGIAKQKLGPSGLQELMRRAQSATGSMGSHDPKAIGEKPVPKSNKRKVRTVPLDSELADTKSFVKRMLSSSDDVVKSEAVVAVAGNTDIPSDDDSSKSKKYRRSKGGTKGKSDKGQKYTKKSKAKQRQKSKKAAF
eukprot:Selendium_serpulae@DN6357_c0_g3_i9.p1